MALLIYNQDNVIDFQILPYNVPFYSWLEFM